jgi:hypothetical protein
MQRLLLIGLVVLGTFSFAPSSIGQTRDSQVPTANSPSPSEVIERDIAARKQALLNESNDLEEMAKSLNGSEFQAALQLDEKAGQGVMELDATIWFLRVYDNMQCEADREVARVALKNRLGFYSHLLGLEADQAAGSLAFVRLPATAQAGARIKDDLRAAKRKLDEIAASLE